MYTNARVAFLVLACSLATLVIPARASDAMVDEVFGKYFFFSGLNTRLDGIQTVAKADGNPILTNIGTWGAYPNSQSEGYLLVHFTQQNPSSSEDRGVGSGNCKYNVGYELQDGSQRSMSPPDLAVMGAKNIEAPDGLQLHPKETKQFTYVLIGWNGSPVTKLFLQDACKGDYPAYDKGLQYVRIPVSSSNVSVLAPTPGGIPGQ